MKKKTKVKAQSCKHWLRVVSGKLCFKKKQKTKTKEKELRFAKMLRTRKIDLGAHLKEEDKQQGCANRGQTGSRTWVLVASNKGNGLLI